MHEKRLFTFSYPVTLTFYLLVLEITAPFASIRDNF